MNNAEYTDASGPFEARYLAFLETITNLRPSLHRYCSRMTGSVMDGEDVVQDALFQAYRKLDTFDDSRPLAPWLFRIAHNRCIDFLRRHEVRKEAETAAVVPDRVMPVDPPGLDLGRAVEHLVLTISLPSTGAPKILPFPEQALSGLPYRRNGCGDRTPPKCENRAAHDSTESGALSFLLVIGVSTNFISE